jgi:hypothetical protein
MPGRYVHGTITFPDVVARASLRLETTFAESAFIRPTFHQDHDRKHHPQHFTRLDVRIVSLRRQTLDILELDSVRLTRGLGQPLQLDRLAVRLRILPSLGVALDAVDELLAGARVRDVLEADVDALLQVAVADFLVDDHADGGLGHVVHDAGLAVVDFVGHALLLRTVVLDVHDVADLVLFPVRWVLVVLV